MFECSQSFSVDFLEFFIEKTTIEEFKEKKLIFPIRKKLLVDFFYDFY